MDSNNISREDTVGVGPSAFACDRSCGGGVARGLNAGATTFWLCVSGSVSLAEVKPSSSPVDWSGHQVLSCCCDGVGGGNSCVDFSCGRCWCRWWLYSLPRFNFLRSVPSSSLCLCK